MDSEIESEETAESLTTEEIPAEESIGDTLVEDTPFEDPFANDILEDTAEENLEESLPEEERSVPLQAPCQSCNKSGHIIRALEPPIFKRKETKK